MPLKPESMNPDGDESKQPTWRRHFPIDTDKEAAASRRAFLGGASVAAGTIVCGQGAINAVSSEPQNAEWVAHEPLVLEKRIDQLNENEAFLFHYPDKRTPCLLIRLRGEQLIALTQKCTHLACPVIPDFTANELHCPCHHGSFEIESGKPLAGPPRSALRRVRIERRDDGVLLATGLSSV